MASIPPSNGKVALVTGINGFIGAWVAMQMLLDGYNLRGTVRRPESVEQLLSGPWKAYVDAGRVEVVAVQDMTAPGAFDKAVKGVDNVQHVASPVIFTAPRVEDFVGPAVQGVLGLLLSALKHGGPGLRVVTLTSSIVAVMQPDEVKKYTAADWNQHASKLIEKEGDATPGMFKYAYSKTMAEKAFWKFQKDNKPQYAMAAVHPAMTYGPLLLFPKDRSGISQSLQIIDVQFTGGEIQPTFGTGDSIDVRDVAKMHAWTASHPEDANGNRYFCSAGKGLSQATADILRRKYGEKIAKGNPGEGYDPKTYESIAPLSSFDNTNVKQALGTLIGIEEMVLATAKSLEHYGH